MLCEQDDRLSRKAHRVRNTTRILRRDRSHTQRQKPTQRLPSHRRKAGDDGRIDWRAAKGLHRWVSWQRDTIWRTWSL